MKKGQVTMFVILGIIIIIVIAAVFFLKDTISKSLNEAMISRSSALQQQSEATKTIVEDCLMSISKDAILEVMAQGGYYQVEEPLYYGFYSIPVYYNQGEEKTPILNDVEESIKSYVSDHMMLCTGNFDALKFTANPAQEMDIDVAIAKEVSVTLEWKITIGDEEKAIISVISEFSATLEKDLKSVYDKSMELYEKQKKEQLISLVDLATLAKDEDYLLHFDFTEDTVLYILTFENIKINEEPVTYTFAIKPEETGALEYGGEDFSEIFEAASAVGDLQYGDSFEDYAVPEEEDKQEEEDDFEF